MGNFPYPSNYLVFQATQDPAVKLPAFPVRAACELMTRQGHALVGEALLPALRDAAGVLYNASGSLSCFELPTGKRHCHADCCAISTLMNAV